MCEKVQYPWFLFCWQGFPMPTHCTVCQGFPHCATLYKRPSSFMTIQRFMKCWSKLLQIPSSSSSLSSKSLPLVKTVYRTGPRLRPASDKTRVLRNLLPRSPSRTSESDMREHSLFFIRVWIFLNLITIHRITEDRKFDTKISRLDQGLDQSIVTLFYEHLAFFFAPCMSRAN